MNQYEEFHDFENDDDEVQMIEYSKNESMTVIKKRFNKTKIIKDQVKKLITFKKLKVSDSIRVMRNKKRFDIEKMMNLVVSLLMSQLLNESQQLRKKFA
jgi:hypothetical protein